ncbi:MAG: hypothetical protein M1348_03355 [Candidatus Parvarchaeota archaeon]|jgi:hypothetical protein|nr:hypothetical protein [Candidatus Parvarchaeota archaeon]MCL5101618.1 hypothetical protein [Candidatus Parvarchaeota archaeon]
MTENNWVEKLVTAIVTNMLANKQQDLTFNLEKVELKTPLFEKPIMLSGKLTVEFSTGKKSKK